MQKPCAVCGDLYEAKRVASRFCSDTCRKRHQRDPDKVTPAAAPVVSPAADLVAETLGTLEVTERIHTPMGQLALVLARRIDSGHETGAAVAALSKQFAEVLDRALDGVEARVNPLDELRVKRDQRRTG